MECLICRDLERAYDVEQKAYIEARSSACYRITKKFAAEKNVDMERARYALEEHRSLCILACKVLVLSAGQDSPARLRQLAA